MKKNIGVLIALVAPAVLMGLLGYVTLSRNKPNGFRRIFKEDAVSISYKLTSSNKFSSIAGFSSNFIYLQTDQPGIVCALTNNLKQMNVFVLAFQANQKITNAFTTTVDSPNIQIFAGNVPAIFTGNLNRQDSSDKLWVTGKPFRYGLQISKRSYVIQQYDSIAKDFLFAVIDQNGNILKKEKGVSQLSHDDGITSQGTILYDPEHQRISFIYKLFNTVIVMDTNLNLLHRFHTIDTIQHAFLASNMVRQRGKTIQTFSRPPQYTNYRACLSSNKLYIYSKLKADNEASQDEPVIDVYNLNNYKYQYSFSLPTGKGDKLTDFKVKDNFLIALYNHGKNVINYKLR